MVSLFLQRKEASRAERIVEDGIVMLLERIEVLAEGSTKQLRLPRGDKLRIKCLQELGYQ